MPRLLRLIVALGCLVLALVAAGAVALAGAPSGRRRARSSAGDCPATDRRGARTRFGALGSRAEPWELIAYCDVRLGQPKLAIGAAEAAVRRDPDNWEYHYALALVRGADRQDPRPAAADALRLNPLQPEAQERGEGVQDAQAGRLGAPRPAPAAVPPLSAAPALSCGFDLAPVRGFPLPGANHDSRSTPSMARGDVRIAVTLACEECKRRNYQTNKSKRNNPDRISLRKYCRWCRRHTGHRETR